MTIAETLLFNLWFIVPFLDYFTGVSTKINYIDPMRNYPLSGLDIGEFFYSKHKWICRQKKKY